MINKNPIPCIRPKFMVLHISSHYNIRCWTLDVQFYRQKPIGHYIVDFFAPKANLVVEVDGSQHKQIEHEKKDNLRDGYFSFKGIAVLRFNANDVIREIDSVTQRIYEIMKKRLAG